MNDKLCIATLRGLALDEIDTANSGHPGMALGSAPILHTLYANHIISTPKDSNWIKRDRFVLSSGHASSLLYAMLHLTGYRLSLDDLKEFRQINSKTPGHPEYRHTDGVDVSTGPLGQGIASAVGMAMAETHLCATYPKFKHLLEHYTYVLCGDGDLQEGVALEALALAGNYKLNKLIIIYDNNDVTLDGPLSNSSTDNIKAKVEAMNFNVLEVADGNDVNALNNAINDAKKANKPSMIIVKTIIGYGSANQGTCKVHGSPLTFEGSKIAKANFGFDNHELFYVPEEVREAYLNSYNKRGYEALLKYNEDIEKLSAEDRKEYLNLFLENPVKDIKEFIPNFEVGYNEATRNISGDILNVYSSHTNMLFGGSADVAGSVKTGLKGKKDYTCNSYDGQNVNFGIREFAMATIANGIAAHGLLKPYVGCFLVFSDYCKSALRMASLMKLPVTYLFSHDSLAVGEDGPTHQPIEQVSALRLIPNFNLIRPADARETVGAYEVALSSTKTPTAIILTRQKLKTYDGFDASKVKLGAYVVSHEKARLDACILATGSEVNLAMQAKEILEKENIDVRVVSMPSTFLFESQKEEYKNEVLPDRNKTIACEMGSGALWYKYANKVMSVESFGASGKENDVYKAFNFTVDNLVKQVKELVK